jgi:hypothetical protein
VGTGQLNTAVADAGPLIHLSEIGCLSVMCIFDILHVPEAVWSETVIQGRVPEADLMGLSVVRRHTLSQSEVTRFTRKGSGLLGKGVFKSYKMVNANVFTFASNYLCPLY